MKALVFFMLLLAASIGERTWAAEEGLKQLLPFMAKAICGYTEASTQDTEGIRTVVERLRQYYNNANSPGQFQSSPGDSLLDNSIDFTRYDAPGPWKGKEQYGRFLDFDMTRFGSHNMGPVTDQSNPSYDPGVAPIEVYMANDPNAACAYVKYEFTYSLKGSNLPPQTVKIIGTWRFTRATNGSGWIVSYTDVNKNPQQ